MRRLLLLIVVALLAPKSLVHAQPTQPSTLPAQTHTLEYFRKITVRDYERIGSRNRNWDEPARQTLEALAHVLASDFLADGDEYDVIMSNTRRLQQAGCSDPLVMFARARGAANFSRKLEDITPLHVESARRIADSAYDPLLKALANLRAAGIRARDHSDARVSRRDGRRMINEAMEYLPRVLADPGMPDEVILDLLDLTGDTSMIVERDRAVVFNQAIALIELSKVPRPAGLVMTARAEFYFNYALDTARDTKSDPQQVAALRSQRLSEAAAAGQQAWRDDPAAARAAEVMMQVEQARGSPRETIDDWFNRAVTAQPQRYSAYLTRLKCAAPATGNDTREMVEFGRRCLHAPGALDSGVALVLVEAHLRASRFTPAGEQDDPRREYFTGGPQIWEDVRAAYQPFVAAHPDSLYHRSRFAQLAAWCGQWSAADEQLRAMGEGKFSLSWFRSREAYLKQRSEVLEHLRGPKTAPAG